jgi:hypothetical protein
VCDVPEHFVLQVEFIMQHKDSKVVVLQEALEERQRRHRQWTAIQASMSRRKAQRTWFSGLTVMLTLALVALAASTVVARSNAQAEPLRVESGASSLDLEFSDGTRLTLEPSSRVRVIELGDRGQRVEVEAGAARLIGPDRSVRLD